MKLRPGYAIVCGVMIVLALFMGGVVLYGDFTNSVGTQPPITLQVRPGETLSQVTSRLGREGVLRHPRLLRLLAILRGDSAHIKAGEYLVDRRLSPNELLDYMVEGKTRYVSLTIPEGFSLADIAERIQNENLGRAKEVLRLAHDPAFIASLQLPFQPKRPTLEGFVFPETYYVHRGVSEAALLAAMVHLFKTRAAPLLVAHAAQTGMTPYDVLILASIIEKETGVSSERPLISAVFRNRLQARMRLGSDPTVIYGLKRFDGNLTRVHLRTKTPYNTYRIFGLPPTPIANPGLASIRAALHPANVTYLYFVAKGDGTHFFSSDIRTHNRAVWKYQVRPNRKPKS